MNSQGANPIDIMLQFQEHAQRETLELWERYLRSPEAEEENRTDAWGTTPHEVVYEEGTLKLLHFRNEQPIEWLEPILICFSLINRPYILDLQEKRSVVRRLLEGGFEVYLIDWGPPADEDHVLGLEDYICLFTRNVTEFVCRRTHAPQVNLLGYCMGGTMSAMFTALYPEQVRNLILMAAPIDFGGDEGLLNLWSQADCLDVDGLIDSYGNCPGWFLQSCFQLMKPVQNYVEKYLSFSEKLDDEAFLENFFAMERWANDNIPVAGETFREFVKKLYQQNQLVKGEMSLGGAAVSLEAITCPLLALVAENDHLVPPASTLAAREWVGSKDVHSISISTGHIGLAVSSKAHQQLWPEATAWIADHSTERRASSATRMGASEEPAAKADQD